MRLSWKDGASTFIGAAATLVAATGVCWLAAVSGTAGGLGWGGAMLCTREVICQDWAAQR